jgi:hypothetical protein
MILLKIDWKLTLGVASPLIIWMLLLMIVFWKLVKRYPLGKWSQTDPNPYSTETLGMPRGTIRAVLTLTILAVVMLLQLYAINNMESMEKISTMLNAFELVLAFYFGSKVMHHLASVDKNKTKAVAEAEKATGSDFDDPEANG